MNTIARKLSIFVLIAVAATTTALTIGTTTILAVSNTQTPQFQPMGNEDSLASTTNELGDFNSAQYAWSHQHHHHSADLNGNNDIQLMGMTHMPVNWTGDFGSGDFGDFNSAQYGGVQPDNHHSSGNMIGDFNGDNSNSTAGTSDRGDFSSAQYGSSGSHSHHHKDSTAPNSSWMWPTHRSTSPDDVYVS